MTQLHFFNSCLYILCIVYSSFAAEGLNKPLFDQLILVEKGDVNACVFEHATDLKKGKVVPLTLSSHPGMAVAKQYENERQFGEWRYIESRGDIVENAINVKYEEFTFLKLDSEDLVFDIAFWDMKAGTAVNFVGGWNYQKTYQYGGGRDFVINDDGTISCKHFPNLVLGFDTEKIVNSYFIGPYSTNYNDAKSYCESNGANLAEIYDINDQRNAQTACGIHTCWIGFIEQGGDSHTSILQQVWKWENGREVSYINWAPGEPNNFMGVDERNSIMNCCVERCTTCDGSWFDAPNEYNQPRPLCVKSKYTSQRSYYEDEDEDNFMFKDIHKRLLLLLKVSAVVIGIMITFNYCMKRWKICGPFTRSMYGPVNTVNDYDQHETEMVANSNAKAHTVTHHHHSNLAVATPSAPATLI